VSKERKKEADRLPLPTSSEAAFEKLLASYLGSGVAVGESPKSRARDEFVARLYAHRDKFLAPRTIAASERFNTKIVGVSFEGRQDIVSGLHVGASLTLERQPENPHDPNAIAVFFGNLQLGYIRKEHAVHIAPAIDSGVAYRSYVSLLTGGGERNRGVNIVVERARAPEFDSKVSASIDADAAAIRHALIGDNTIRPEQQAVLERLENGKNTLAVLGTGRGKSFCFQYPAAVRALDGGQRTVAVYPLRALANDQFEAARRRFDGFGLRIFRANGSIDATERAGLFDALADGSWDIVFATPEFLQFHLDAFSRSSQPSLVVVDEAHHVYDSRHREAYSRLGDAIRELGAPQVLALTATAHEKAFGHIMQELAIESWVIDPTVRVNLHVIDARETVDKVAYLRELFEGSGKAIVYCNSKPETVNVAEQLRKTFGNETIYYHGGLDNEARLTAERFFREGDVRVVVATTAFGEGIDLPDVRDVVLYHLNFSFTEFNQQAGRAGRDGAPARIHLLFGEKDRALNEFLINRGAPTLPVLREIYKGMRELARNGIVRTSPLEIERTLDIRGVKEQTIGAAVQIFEETALLEIDGDEEGRFVRFLPARERIDLTKNERFAEGEAERENFARFADLALSANAQALETIINRPIYPSDVALMT